MEKFPWFWRRKKSTCEFLKILLFPQSVSYNDIMQDNLVLRIPPSVLSILIARFSANWTQPILSALPYLLIRLVLLIIISFLRIIRDVALHNMYTPQGIFIDMVRIEVIAMTWIKELFFLYARALHDDTDGRSFWLPDPAAGSGAT